MKIKFLVLLLLLQAPAFAAEVNIYSARKEALIKPLLERFTGQTGVTVNLVTGKADTLLKRLEAEGRNSPADVLITIDAARLIRGKRLGLFQSTDSNTLQAAIPARYRDADKQWFGLSLRSRVLVYAPERVNESELDGYFDLAEPKWRGRICIRSSSNVYNQSLVAALIAHYGPARTERWARALVENLGRPPKGGDRDQIKAVAAGVCDVAVVNNYYLAGMLASTREDQVQAAQKVALFWPDQAARGAHMNVSGAAILKAGRNKPQALRLLEFLVSDEAQRWYAEKNHEYPVKPGINSGATLQGWGSFKADDLNLNLLGEHNAAAVKLMDRAGWK